MSPTGKKRKKSPLNRFKCKLEEKKKETRLIHGEAVYREFADFVGRLLTNDKNNNALREAERRLEEELELIGRKLPVYPFRSRLVEAVDSNDVTVVVAETGSGKSSQIVRFLHQLGKNRNGCIVCTQPRKIAALGLSQFVGSFYNNDDNNNNYRVSS